MADKRRGKAGVSRKMKEKPRLASSSEDEDAPDEVTFQDSKTAALQSMKAALDSARRDKERLKERRKRRLELFEEQKKQRMLPIELLEEIDAATSKKPEEPEPAVNEAALAANAEEASSSGVEMNETSDTEDKKRPGLKGNYSVMRVKDQPLAAIRQKAAMDFLHSRLYGAGSQRTTTNELVSLERKRAQNKSAALQFVQKDWGHQRKQKAEKFKKRWIRRKKAMVS